MDPEDATPCLLAARQGLKLILKNKLLNLSTVKNTIGNTDPVGYALFIPRTRIFRFAFT